MNQTTYAREFDDADLAALADSGEHYLDESGFFFMPTQSEMQEVAEIGDTLFFLDLFRSFWHQLRVCAPCLGMNSELRNVARTMKGRNAGRNPGLKGVLIYNNYNFGAGVRARRFFESLACDWEKSLEEQIWKFDDCSRGPKDASGIPCLGGRAVQAVAAESFRLHRNIPLLFGVKILKAVRFEVFILAGPRQNGFLRIIDKP